MKALNKIALGFLFFIATGPFLSGCDSSGAAAIQAFVNSNNLLITSVDLMFDNKTRRLAFATDASGRITLVDIRRKKIIDLDEFDSEGTPISLGGNLTSIFEWSPLPSNEDALFSLVVVDRTNKRLFVIDAIATTVATVPTTAFTIRDFGDTSVVEVSRPVFSDRGRRSTPTISDIDLDASVVKTEHWRVRSRGNRIWEIEGSLSGIQEKRATSNEVYTSDDGSITFTISEGDRISTRDDLFFFGTINETALALPGTPEGAKLSGDRLFIANGDSGQLEVLDLLTETFATPVPLNDGTGETVLPSSIDIFEDTAIVSNLGAGNSIFRISLSDLSVQSFIVGFPSSLVSIAGGNNLATLLPVDDFSLQLFDLQSNTLAATPIELRRLALTASPLTSNSNGDMLVATTENAVEVIDLEGNTTVDTNTVSGDEAFAGNILFFDNDESNSDPSISDIITEDGLTKSESWVLNFEGSIEGSIGNSGVANGLTFTDANALFTQSTLAIGDALVLFPNDPANREEHLIASIDSDTQLTLETAPQTSSTSIVYKAQVVDAYTVTGSVSGLQQTRLFEGQSGASDNNEIRLSINPANPLTPTTPGDFFSFSTDSGITPILLSGDFPRDMAVFEGRSYILTQNGISLINLSTLKAENGINN